MRYRQIHMDYHTSPHIPGVGSRFDAERFADGLARAHVDSVTCFARCHHGHLYYDSKRNPERIHPTLVERDLLKKQIDACHARGIRVPIYTTVQWDDFTVKEHPEWLALEESGAPIGGDGAFGGGFYRTLCLHSPYRQFLKDHVAELLETFAPVDGLFFDILFPNACCCPRCVARMRALGMDPTDIETRRRFSMRTLDAFMLEMTAFIRDIQPDAGIFYNSSHDEPSVRNRLDAYTHLELESLPSGGWGYLHFPTTARFARSLGRDVIGMTGKFHTEWGDFHSFKNRAALEYECFRMLALNAGCSIGDQLAPEGDLSEPVYELIGPIYKSVAEKEPWCVGATAVSEIGLFTLEEARAGAPDGLPPAMLGAVRMMTECGFQFDVVDSRSDLSAYRLLVLPDAMPMSDALKTRLDAHLAAGGAVIAVAPEGDWAPLPVRVRAEQPRDDRGNPVFGSVYDRNDWCQYLIPRQGFAAELPRTEHVMYLHGLEADATERAEVLADGVLPHFDRTGERFCSHRQTPSSGAPGTPAIVLGGRVAWFAHPIFTQYRRNAPRWCRILFRDAVLRLMEPLLTHDGPTTLMATVNRQTATNLQADATRQTASNLQAEAIRQTATNLQADAIRQTASNRQAEAIRQTASNLQAEAILATASNLHRGSSTPGNAETGERWIVHLLHYIPERRSETLDIIEDVIPLHNLRVSLKTEFEPRFVSLVPEGVPLPFTHVCGRISFTVPRVDGHRMIAVSG